MNSNIACIILLLLLFHLNRITCQQQELEVKLIPCINGTSLKYQHICYGDVPIIVPGLSMHPARTNYRVYYPFIDTQKQSLCSRGGALVTDFDIWGSVDPFIHSPQSCADIFCQTNYNLVPDALKLFATNETFTLAPRVSESIALLYSYCLYCGEFQEAIFPFTNKPMDIFHDTILYTKNCHKYIPFFFFLGASNSVLLVDDSCCNFLRS